MSTPQLRSRELLTEQGFLVATVEARKSFPDKKKQACRVCGHQPLIEVRTDLFGCFDLLAVHPLTQEVAFVQVTSYEHHSARRNKVLASFETKLVLLAGCKVWIHSWRKDERLNRWVIREEALSLKHFAQAPHYPSTVRQMLEIRRKAKAPDLPVGSTLPLQEPF